MVQATRLGISSIFAWLQSGKLLLTASMSAVEIYPWNIGMKPGCCDICFTCSYIVKLIVVDDVKLQIYALHSASTSQYLMLSFSVSCCIIVLIWQLSFSVNCCIDVLIWQQSFSVNCVLLCSVDSGSWPYRTDRVASSEGKLFLLTCCHILLLKTRSEKTLNLIFHYLIWMHFILWCHLTHLAANRSTSIEN